MAQVQIPPMEWWISFRHPQDIWKLHPNFLLGELIFYGLAYLTFQHAVRNGGRYIYLWFTTILHGLVVESLSYFMPDIDNFWHAQSMVMMLGNRLPLHVMLIYPVFIYTAAVAVSRLHFRRLPEAMAVGLAVVALDVPFDIMGIKLLWWSWHDTDPNIYDRHYWVPWTSYYFHASFASAFMFLFHGTRSLASSTEKYQSDGFFKEVLCSVVTGLFAMPCGILQFIPLYHPLHDAWGIHTEVCVFLFLGLFILEVWVADRQPCKEARSMPNKGWFDELGLLVVLHFLTYIVFVFTEKPEQIRSHGLHEMTGNCSARSPVQTASGLVLMKNSYLCTKNYDEAYYDFHCLPGGKPPKDGEEWYTICGTPYDSHVEYKVVVTAFCLLGLYVYLTMLAWSGRQPSTRPVGKKQKKH